MGNSLKYGELKFPSECGFSGSAGKTQVRGYARGGMAAMKGAMTTVKGPAAPAPKADMLYSKKEVSAKNLLSEGRAPNLPHAKGSVNMKHGGMAQGGMTPKQQAKVGKVMGEFKAGELHSGSKTGPMVKDRKQAIAIGLSEARKAGKK